MREFCAGFPCPQRDKSGSSAEYEISIGKIYVYISFIFSNI